MTYVSANWIVPSYPTNYVGSNAPGFWFGIEPAPATDLIQPSISRYSKIYLFIYLLKKLQINHLKLF